eukprot:TRINITY_DN11502_c0_g3_i1.p1 TRINITY_DN11502_c0_g3~~TRINITY_DN11502_c0_g3_i1.p1  ORF type:complete len:778 (+),score=139.77 TRINITY_DN11502_c0_g3_i1:49-2382(+)
MEPSFDSDGEIDSDATEGLAGPDSNRTVTPEKMHKTGGEDIMDKEEGELSGDDVLSECENHAGGNKEFETKLYSGNFEDQSLAQETSDDAKMSRDITGEANTEQQTVEAGSQMEGDQECRRRRKHGVRKRRRRTKSNSSDGKDSGEMKELGETKMERTLESRRRKRARHTLSTVDADTNTKTRRLARSRKQINTAEDGRESRKKRTVFVGSCPSDCTAQTVKEAFDQAFLELPAYRRLYGDCAAVAQVHIPAQFYNRPGKSSKGDFLFVELKDELLTRTAIFMSGLRIDGVSVRVCPSSSKRVFETEDVLDVEPLRQLGQIPWSGGPGSKLLCDVWLGGLSVADDEAAGPASIDDAFGRHTDKFQFQEFLKGQIEEALLAIPSIRGNFPDLTQPVVDLKIPRDQSCCFAQMANEVLASTLVAMKELPLRSGQVLKTGWPSSVPDASNRAPPPLPALEVKGSPLIASLNDADDLDVCQNDFECAQECEIFISGTSGIEATSLWTKLTELFERLPSYREAYSEAVSPIVHIRLGVGSFSFARLLDARLASTAAKLGFLLVNGVRLMLARPSHYEWPPAGPEPSLEIPSDYSKSYCKSQDPAKLPASAEMLAKLPTPPPPPTALPTTHVMWVGSIVSHRQRREWQMQQLVQQQADSMQEVSETSWDEFPVRDLLDARLTELAMQIPGYDIDAGPPIERVQVCEGGHGPYAFVEVAGSREWAEKLLEAFHDSDFFGKPLAVRWDRRPGQPARKERQERRKREIPIPAGIAKLLPGHARQTD